MSRFYRIFLFLFLVFLSPLTAQEYQLINVRYLPADYYVGDTVEMRFTLRMDQAGDLQVPEGLPDTGWVRVLSLGIEPGGADRDVVLRFIPYSPGTRTLPALDLGAVTVDDLKIFTSSVLAGDPRRELAGIRDNLLIPGTRPIGALIVSLFLSVPVLIIIMIRAVRRQTGELLKTYRLNLPYRKFLRLLKKIRLTMTDMNDRDFLKSFTRGLKNYLSTRFHQDLDSATTLEIESILMDSPVHETLGLSLLNIFHRLDGVKFAGEEMTEEEREGMLTEVEQISEELENWRRKHADL